jgi:sortase A
VLILAGCLLIMLAITAEALQYPWGTRDMEAPLPDPPLPTFEVLSYAEYLEMIGVEKTVITLADIEILPGGNVQAEYIHEAVQEPEPEAISEAISEPLPEQAFTDEPDEIPQATPEPVPEPEPEIHVEINRYVLLGSVKIPKINISANLYLGIGDQMNHGVGHLEGTPLPGGRGNSVLAAHRTATRGTPPFRYLDLLSDGDAIIVDFDGDIFTYTVYDSFIVGEHDTWVLGPVKGEPHILTLVTCDPVVTARTKDRLIVRARLEE